MQVTLSQTHVRRLVRGFAKIVNAHGSPMPVLDCARFRRRGASDAEAAVTDLEETLVLALPGCASGEGGPDEFLCPLGELRRLARDLGRGDAAVLAPLAGGPPRLDIVLQVGGRDIRSRLDTIDPAEFPETLVPVAAVAADVGAFLAAFRTALPFVSQDESRAILNNVFWHDEAHALVATDGRRVTKLCLETLALGRDIVLAPSKALANGILDGGAGTLGVAEVAERLYLDVACGPWHWQGRGVEGEYPNYGMAIPADVGQFAATVEIAAADLPLVRSAIPRLADDVTTVAVHLCAVPGKPPLLVSARTEEDGSRVQVELPGSRCRTETLQIQPVNGRYLLECLEAGFLTLRLPADCSPWLCTGGHPGVHCVMPMRDDTCAIAALVAGGANPGEDTMPHQMQTAAPPTAPDAAAPETAPAAPPAADGSAAPALSLVPSDPLQDLRGAVAEADDSLRQAATAVRTLRERVRAVERLIRDREKQYARSEKVLDQLKLVAGF